MGWEGDGQGTTCPVLGVDPHGVFRPAGPSWGSCTPGAPPFHPGCSVLPVTEWQAHCTRTGPSLGDGWPGRWPSTGTEPTYCWVTLGDVSVSGPLLSGL